MAENIILTKLRNVNTTFATKKKVKNNMHKVVPLFEKKQSCSMLSKRVEIEGRRIPLISLDTCMSASNAKVNRKK
jgi:hypothetical protein